MLKGKAFLFEQPEVHIGRTTDNDVVLQDAGVSRRHVRIAERLGRYFVQDLDSAHGTRLNARRIAGEQELRDGDRLLVGDVECVFARVSRARAAPATTAPSDDEDDDDDQATLVGASPRKAERAQDKTRIIDARVDARAVNDDDDAETMTGMRPDLARLVEDDRAATLDAMPVPPSAAPPATLVEMPAVEMPAVQVPAVQVPTAATGRPPVVALAAPTQVEMPAVAAPGRPPVLVIDAPTTRVEMPALLSPSAKKDTRLSAAERARLQRQHGGTLGGQFVVWWAGLSPRRRLVAGGVSLGCVVGLLGVLVAVFWPRSETHVRGHEPDTLSSRAIPDSFGLGQGVQWEHPDDKAFEFEFVSPSRAVALLRYHAIDISREEVSLTVNGTQVGWVPPDIVSSEEREVQLVLSPSVLKRSDVNRLVFDNVRNPPGRETWQVWNVRLEIIPVPELPPEELLESARTLARRARDFYDRRTVGPANLFRSWENYRSAWITLEALEKKPDLYQDVRHMLGQVSTELDQMCGQLMLDFQRHVQLGKTKRAATVLEEINRRFPTEAHRCHNLAAEKATGLGP